MKDGFRIFDTHTHIGAARKILTLDIPDEDKRNILGQTAGGVFR